MSQIKRYEIKRYEMNYDPVEYGGEGFYMADMKGGQYIKVSELAAGLPALEVAIAGARSLKLTGSRQFSSAELDSAIATLNNLIEVLNHE